jgi:uncharacterized protein (DUF1697 family)
MSAGALYVALFRGINVGTAKALPMPELKRVLEGLGFSGVTTVLRSGSAVFSASSRPAASAIEAAVEKETGIHSDVIVLSSEEFAAIASANPLRDAVSDGSKGFVTFSSEPVGAVEMPDPEQLGGELIAVGERAVYQWMPDGSMQTKVPKSFWKQFDGTLTARNLNTVERVLTLLDL